MVNLDVVSLFLRDVVVHLCVVLGCLVRNIVMHLDRIRPFAHCQQYHHGNALPQTDVWSLDQVIRMFLVKSPVNCHIHKALHCTILKLWEFVIHSCSVSRLLYRLCLSPKLSIAFRFSDYHFIVISEFLQARSIALLSKHHHPWYDHLDKIYDQTMTLFNTIFSPTSCHLNPELMLCALKRCKTNWLS